MTLVGVDLHTREQTVAVLDTATGEREDLRLRHDGEAVERFYAGLRPPVTVAIESTGYALWFHALMPRLGHTLLVGDAAKIRASVVRKTETDRRDARHILTLLSEKRLPTVWVPDPGDEQASYAQFTDLESALVTAGISFDRLSDPVAEYGECVRFFRPGMTKPYDAASEGYEPMLPVREVRRRFADGLDNLGAWLDPLITTANERPDAWAPDLQVNDRQRCRDQPSSAVSAAKPPQSKSSLPAVAEVPDSGWAELLRWRLLRNECFGSGRYAEAYP